ncbi:MAG: elongation factor P [Spirochaetes bacterium]|nr:MAG: elongation factor P [Spirochaetota bacterium]RKY01587.1 MAG: elongation factor P [Spirochaetota bacterium]
MITANDLRRGVVIKVNGDLFAVLDFQHTKPGKGGAFVKAKLRNLTKNTIIDKTFRSTEKVEDVFIEKRKMQYLYNDGDSAVFMDLETYEQEQVPNNFVEDQLKFLKEGEEVDVDFYDNQIISIELPTFVILEVTHTEPGVKGDTATAAYKPATVETGAQIQVPLFVNEGDKIKIDTRTGEYIERA